MDERAVLRPVGSARASLLLLGLGLPLAVVAGVLPSVVGLRLRFLLVLIGVIAGAVGVARNRPSRIRPFALLLAGMTASALGDAIVLLTAHSDGAAANVPADAWLTVVGGVLLLSGMYDGTRTVRGNDVGGTLDALILALACGTMLWQLLVLPTGVPGWVGSGTEIAGGLQVLLFVAVLGLLLRTQRILPARHRFSAGLLGVALAFAIAAFLVGAVREASGGLAHYAGLRAGLGASANLVAGAALLHPTMRALTERLTTAHDRHSGRKLLLLGVALCAAPLILVSEAWTGTGGNNLTLAVAWTALVPAVLARVHLLGRGRDAAQLHASATERRLMSLVAHTGDVLLLVGGLADASGPTIRYASPAAKHVLMRDPVQLVGATPARAVVEAHSTFTELLVGPGELPRSGDVEVELPDGSHGWLEVIVDDYEDPTEDAALVVTLRDVTDRKRSELRWAEAAMCDPLTGLLNRRGIEEALGDRLGTAGRPDGAIGLMLCDLDGFKEVNDQQGHVAGDEVLRAVASRMLAVIRPDDLVGRLGGDEFVLICTGPDHELALERIAYRLIAAMQDPIDFDGVTMTVGLSAGIAVTTSSTTSATELLHQADLALYQAKQTGRGRAVWSLSPSMASSSA